MLYFFTDVMIGHYDINKNAASPAAAIKEKAHHFSCFCFLTSKMNIPSFAVCNDAKKSQYFCKSKMVRTKNQCLNIEV